ncbi:hypothetical protein pb186bvf_005949 [Paramecium bursaria]
MEQMFSHKIAVAPMIVQFHIKQDITYEHFRVLMRFITQKCFVYTEMIHERAILDSKILHPFPQVLDHQEIEHPVVCQLGGNDPLRLAAAAKIAQDAGYDEINLNVGCPSERVQDGAFGACLMKEPNLVAKIMKTIRENVQIPCTVKCRLGVDDYDSYEFAQEFVNIVHKEGGVNHFIIHARKAFLKGLNPAQNRSVPPLKYEYDLVYQLKKDFPQIKFSLNGGIRTVEQIDDVLQYVDGVMIGRQAYDNPWFFCNFDQRYYNTPNLNYDRAQVLGNYSDFVETKRKNGDRSSTQTCVKPLINLFNGENHNKKYRQFLSTVENHNKYGSKNGRMESRCLALETQLIMIQIITDKAKSFGYDTETVRDNMPYFQHQFGMCICSTCDCGNCNCKAPKYVRIGTKKKRRRSQFTYSQQYSLNVNRSLFDTSQSSYREMSPYPEQYITSNKKQFKGQSCTKALDIRRIETPCTQNEFIGTTQYNQMFRDWGNSTPMRIKRNEPLHTGKILADMETSYQKFFKPQNLINPTIQSSKNQNNPLLLPKTHVPYVTMYKANYDSKPSSPIFEDKQRRQQQLLAQIYIPGLKYENADSVSHRAYKLRQIRVQRNFFIFIFVSIFLSFFSQQKFKRQINLYMETVEEVTKDQRKIYQKGKFLGKGGFAKCYEFIHEGQILAAKMISKATLTKSRQRMKLMSEIKIHRSLNQQNVVNFVHYFEDAENVYILLELCANQTMNELLRRRKRLTELEVQCYLIQILNAIRYLHNQKVIHRDLKLGNLFLSDKMEIKLGDFGLATQLDFEGDRRRTICGTPNYIAPEILESKNGHSFEVDIWSFGVIAYTLLIGKPPFETNDVKTTYRRIKMNAYQFPDNITISPQAKNLIQKILQTDPSKRPTLDEIQQHEFFIGNIPQLLPVSTLACPPSSTYLRQFTKQLSTSQQKFENTVKDVITKYSSQAELKMKPNNLYKSMDRLPTKPMPIDNPLNQNYILTEPTIFLKKWVDYSSKYGLGYLLNNGQVGVYFNDCTKILLIMMDDYVYFDRNNEEQIGKIDTPPNELNKKATLLKHFKGYLIDQENQQPYCTNKIYVKKWMKTKHAIVFRLSDKTVQVVFTDNSQVILSKQLKVVTYVDKFGTRETHYLNQALESDNAQMVKRLKYTKEILSNLLQVATKECNTSRNK